MYYRERKINSSLPSFYFCPVSTVPNSLLITYYTYFAHRHCSLNSCCYSIYSGTHAQEINCLILLSDCIFCMYSCNFHVTLLDCLFKNGGGEGILAFLDLCEHNFQISYFIFEISIDSSQYLFSIFF